MDAEEFFRREAAELLAEYPGLTPEEIAREVEKDGCAADPEITATVLAVAAEMKARSPQAPTDDSLIDDDEIPWRGEVTCSI